MQERSAHHASHLPLIAVLVALSAPLVVMYVYQILDTVTTTPPGSIVPDGVTLRHWRFLTGPLSEGGPTIWSLAGNTQGLSEQQRLRVRSQL